MKKSILKLALVSLTTIALASCGTTSNSNSTKEPEVINIQFVPSNDPGKLATLAANMAPLLSKYEPNYKFNITTGTTYAATTTAMLSGQVDIGFLTASGYAEVTLKNPGKVEVLMTSVRKGYQVQVDYKTEAEQIKAMNQEVSGYTYSGQQSTEDVNWYSSQLVVNKNCYKDVNGDGKIDVLDLAGKKIARQGTTSGAGYLRPLKYLYDHGMEMVDTLDSTKTNQIQGVAVTGYTAAFDAMANGDVDGFWGYTDVRYSNYYSKTDSARYNDQKLFEDYKVIAITDGIYNDTISARSGLSQAAKDAVKHAFKELVKDGDINTEGTGAYYLYNLYSHTGYTDAKNSDFDGERSFYEFCVEKNLLK